MVFLASIELTVLFGLLAVNCAVFFQLGRKFENAVARHTKNG